MNRQHYTGRKAPRRCRMTVLASMLDIVFGVAVLSLPASAWGAPFDISQVPIELGGGLPSNLMYIHDDSGSMGSANILNTSNSSGNLMSSYSHLRNKLYFNPDVTYLPPATGDGGNLGNADFNNAWNDGYLTNRENQPKVNLSTGYVASWSSRTDWTVANPGGHAYYNRYVPGGACVVPPTSGNLVNDACFQRVDIVTDGDATQKQNFANWYSYYRIRNFTAKAAMSLAFAELGDNSRVGYGKISKGGTSSVDGKTLSTIERGIRKFEGNDRAAFFKWLFALGEPGMTPLRRAVDDAGQYYENDSEIGPWSSTPGVKGGTTLACRRSYTILMTDGGWNDAEAKTEAAKKNVDGNPGPLITGPGMEPYSYTPAAPYSDSNSNTLADVAMHYWYRDLRPDLPNVVPPSADSPAFWQNMGLFTIGFGVQGSKKDGGAAPTVEGVKATAAAGGEVSWPPPTAEAAKIDDLFHAAVNGHGKYLSASDPMEMVAAVKAIFASIETATQSAASVGSSSSRAANGTRLYSVEYQGDKSQWTGELKGFDYIPADPMASPPVLEHLDLAWSASGKIPAHGARKIYTSKWNGGTFVPIPFTWDNLSPSQQGLFSIPMSWQAVPPAAQLTAQNLLDWLRGDNTHEGGAEFGKFRSRGGKVLGDIVHSGPVYVGTENLGYGTAPGLDATERSAYKNRRATDDYKNRLKMVYAGANDGMLHAFDEATGVEKFAYIPSVLFEKTSDVAPHGKLATLAGQDYQHQYFVDGPSSAADAFIDTSKGKQWKTVLVGSTGAGGRAYFALDVENPASFSEKNVLWEFTHPELGVAIGQAAIVRLESGDWVAIFGNGYNSESNTARLFVVDLATGSLLKMIDTQVGSAEKPNGLASPSAVDSNRNGATDAVYAGDMHGNMWRFDFKGAVGEWKVSFKAGAKPAPLFSNKDEGKTRPIMTRPAVRLNPYRDGTIVYFGTGQFFEVGDQGDQEKESFYGIFDDCGETFHQPVSCQNDVAGGAKVTRNNLLKQEIQAEKLSADFDGETHDVRVITKNTLSADQKGFYLDLQASPSVLTGERVISSPNAYYSDRIVFTSFVPDPNACAGQVSGWLYELDPFTGGRTSFSVFDLNNDQSFNSGEFVSLGANQGSVAVNARKLPGGVAPTILHGEGAAKAVLPGGLSTSESPDPDMGRQGWTTVR